MKEQEIKITLLIIIGLLIVSISNAQEKEIKGKIVTEINFLYEIDTIVKSKKYDINGHQTYPVDTSLKIGYLNKVITLDSTKTRILRKNYYDNGSTTYTETSFQNHIEKLICFNDQNDTLYLFIERFDKIGCLKSMTQYMTREDSLQYEFVGLKNYSDFEFLHGILSQTDFYNHVMDGVIKINFKKGTIKYFALSTNDKVELIDEFQFNKQFIISIRTNYLYHESFKRPFKTKTYYLFNQNNDLIELKEVDEDGEIERMKYITYEYY